MLPDAFGSWETASQEVSFGLEIPISEEMSIWRRDMPEDAQLAEEELGKADIALTEAVKALDRLPERMAGLADRFQTQRQSAGSFTVASVAGLDPPEEDLLQMIDAIQPGFSPASYGWPAQPKENWVEVSRQCVAAFERLQRFITRLAYVETLTGGLLIGRTMVNLKGDLQTAWFSPLKTEQKALHVHSLKQALASRNALMRTSVTVLQGAASLAVLFTGPGGVLLAVPAAWRFVNQILDQTTKAQEKS